MWEQKCCQLPSILCPWHGLGSLHKCVWDECLNRKMSDTLLDVCLCGGDGEITVYSNMQKALCLRRQPTLSCKYLGGKMQWTHTNFFIVLSHLNSLCSVSILQGIIIWEDYVDYMQMPWRFFFFLMKSWAFTDLSIQGSDPRLCPRGYPKTTVYNMTSTRVRLHCHHQCES